LNPPTPPAAESAAAQAFTKGALEMGRLDKPPVTHTLTIPMIQPGGGLSNRARAITSRAGKKIMHFQSIIELYSFMSIIQ